MKFTEIYYNICTNIYKSACEPTLYYEKWDKLSTDTMDISSRMNFSGRGGVWGAAPCIAAGVSPVNSRGGQSDKN